jgi:5-methylcytosine-specific restriction protein B
VVLYGPPGTGKTYHALRVANELSARHTFRKTFAGLTDAERRGIADLVRLCTFHPGFGYEDFVEGLRPRTVNGQMVFESREGIFKQLCADAARQPSRQFFSLSTRLTAVTCPVFSAS